MKIKLFAALTIATSIMLASCGTGQLKGQKLKTATDSISYAFGIYNYYGLIKDSLILDPDLVAKGMKDASNEMPLWSENEAYEVIVIYVNQRNQQRSQAMIEANEKFLTENKARAGVTTTESGLQYEVIKMGNGQKPTLENVVSVHYTGTLIDGTEFDSSVKRNEPAQFPLVGVIQGWTEALQLMPVGSKFKIYVPENLGYGEQGAGGIIQPYSTLIFEVELLEIVR